LAFFNQLALNILEYFLDIINNCFIYLFYLLKNPQLWHDKPIAFGIYHTFDIHLPNWENVLSSSDPYTLVNQDNPFIYQEMTPNEYGILGLNKPKEIITIKADTGNGVIDYELGKRRLILLTLRNTRGIRSFKDIMDLAIHELTHTTCNDVRWKKDNHRDPYPVYHKWMRQWAKECGVI
jgi:hypothetical protein